MSRKRTSYSVERKEEDDLVCSLLRFRNVFSSRERFISSSADGLLRSNWHVFWDNDMKEKKLIPPSTKMYLQARETMNYSLHEIHQFSFALASFVLFEKQIPIARLKRTVLSCYILWPKSFQRKEDIFFKIVLIKLTRIFEHYIF